MLKCSHPAPPTVNTMRAFLAGICFLAAFLATGNALRCVECTNRTSGTCTEEVKLCPRKSSNTCEHSVLEINFGGYPAYQVFKGCSPNPVGGFMYTETVIGLDDRLYRHFCARDLCNSGNITLPPRNNTLNGRKCPTSFNQNTYKFSQPEIMNCRGDETGCSTFQGVVDAIGEGYVITLAQGCTNMENCHPPPEFPANMIPDNQIRICTKALHDCN